MVYLLKIVIFHGYVQLPDDIKESHATWFIGDSDYPLYNPLCCRKSSQPTST